MAKKKSNKFSSQYRVSIAFALPFLIIFFTFTIIPVIAAICMSFTNYNILQPMQFVGFKNYLDLFLNDEVFLTSLKNTFLFAFIIGPLSFAACLFVAWMINEFSHTVRTILTIIFYAPAISGGVITIWAIIFSNDSYGIVNNTLMELGFVKDPILWLQDPKYMIIVIILAALWASLGTSFLSFIAGLQGVDKALYEAGAIDGIKNRIQELWYITVPAIKPQLMFSALLAITGAFEFGAIGAQLVGNPSPQYAAHTIVLHLADYSGIRMELGMACAIAVILFIIEVGANKLVNKLIKYAGN